MVKKYTKVTDEQRRELVRLIQVEGRTIRYASEATGIPYANAKSVNAIYCAEKRTSKKTFRFRLKKVDIGKKVERKLIPVENNPFELMDRKELDRITCGVRLFRPLRPKEVSSAAAIEDFC